MNNLPVDAKYRTRPNRARKSTASLGIQVEVTWDLTYPGHYSSVDMTSVCGQEAGRAGVIIHKLRHGCMSQAALLTKGGRKVGPDV